MQQMFSKIATASTNSQTAIGKLKQLDKLQEVAQRQPVKLAAPTISAQGVPGEYDHRKFLTGAFSGFIPVQNAVGNAAVNTIAVRTNSQGWKNALPQYVNSLFGAQLKPEDESSWYTDLSAEDVVTTTTDDGSPPWRPVVSGLTTPKGFSVRLVQETDKR